LIAYLDTSALVKLYVAEEGSRALRAYASKSEALATSVVAYAEARAAFARLLRSGDTSVRQHSRRLRRFNLDWDDYVRIELTPELVRGAGNVAELHALRGFDAIHLASGLWLKERSTRPVGFAAYDRRLHAAAAEAGMSTHPRRFRGSAAGA
jgi:predicted nucleic acid-binding protein